MNKLDSQLRAQILHMLCEGSSIRSTARACWVSKNTVTKLLTDAGRVCSEYQDGVLRGLTCQRIRVDEVWSFCVTNEDAEGARDVWTWTAMDEDSKLAVAWLVGQRDSDYATIFIDDLRSRLVNGVQLTSDGHKAYLDAVDDVSSDDIDYDMLVRIYGETPDSAEGRDSSSSVPGANGFSKKVENHAHAVALHFMYHNFVKINATLRTSPAVAAGVSKRLWEIRDIVALLEAAEAKADRTGARAGPPVQISRN